MPHPSCFTAVTEEALLDISTVIAPSVTAICAGISPCIVVDIAATLATFPETRHVYRSGAKSPAAVMTVLSPGLANWSSWRRELVVAGITSSMPAIWTNISPKPIVNFALTLLVAALPPSGQGCWRRHSNLLTN